MKSFEIIMLLGVGVPTAVVVLFTASFLYFVFAHRHGTKEYVLKTIAICLLTIPVAILLTCASAAYAVVALAQRTFQFAEAVSRSRRGSGSQARQQVHDDESGGDADVTVHLVHGTFEPDALWTHAGSAMRHAIEGIGHTAKVKVVRFAWTGRNTVTARKEAAKALAQKLEDSPCNRHYVVAHSHGGNIVRELSHAFPAIARKVRGVCLLSPPFIFRKKIERTGGSFVFLHGLGLVLAVQMPVAAVFLPLDLYWPYAAVPTAIISILCEIALAKFFSRELANELEPGREIVEFRDVQIYHAVGDEADSALRFVSFLHESCFGVLSQLRAAAKLAEKQIHWPYVVSYAAFVAAIGYVAANSDVSKDWLVVSFSGLAAILAAHIWHMVHPSVEEPPVLLAAALPIAIFSFFLGAAKAVAYGDLRLIFCPEIFVTSSETPLGDHSVLKLGPESDGTMVHSTHSHTGAVRHVAAWLKRSLDEHETRHADRPVSRLV